MLLSLWFLSAPVHADDAVSVTAEDLTCLQDWPSVGRTRYASVTGRLEEALEVARDPEGGVYPPGTVVVLQPTEAMVKHQPGWSEATHDWEYLKVKVGRKGQVSIAERGAEEVKNIAGFCHACHAPAVTHDHVCMAGHGCDPLPGFILKMALKSVDKDPRCVAR